MKILAFDTCFSTCSIALLDSGQIIAKHQDFEPSQQAGKLIPYIENILQDHDIEYADLKGIAVTTGPGSFTGIRIGLAAANALSLVTGVKIIGITTLEVMAYQALQKSENKNYNCVGVIIDSYKQQLSFQEFNVSHTLPRLVAVKEPLLLNIDEIDILRFSEKYLLTGNAKHLIQDRVEVEPTDNIIIEAQYLAELAWEKLTTGQTIGITEPVYLRQPDAKLPAIKQNND